MIKKRLIVLYWRGKSPKSQDELDVEWQHSLILGALAKRISSEE